MLSDLLKLQISAQYTAVLKIYSCNSNMDASYCDFWEQNYFYKRLTKIQESLQVRPLVFLAEDVKEEEEPYQTVARRDK